MSQDLLSFLDNPQPPTQTAPSADISGLARREGPSGAVESSGKTIGDDTAVSNSDGQVRPSIEDEDDDFGDFEDASPPATALSTPTSASTVVPTSAPRPGQAATASSFQSATSPANAKVPTTETPSPFPPKAPSHSKAPQKSKNETTQKKDNVGSHPFAGRMDLLFGAEEDDYDAGADELGDLANNPEAAMEYSKRVIAEQQELAKGKGKGKVAVGQNGGFVDLEETQSKSIDTKKAPKDPNVLFDVDDLSDGGSDANDDNDDFGDFETWNAPVTNAPARSQAQAQSVAMDLLGLEDEAARKEPPRSAQKRSPTQSKPTPQSTMTPAMSTPKTLQAQDDELWDDFEMTTSKPKNHRDSPLSAQDQDNSWADFNTSAPIAKSTASVQNIVTPTQAAQQLPPTNIPPPLQILTLFPPLFASAGETLFGPISKLDTASRSTLLAHPATHQFLRAYLSSIAVLARIIAGRKFRWKRDQRLSQSMRIGPAAAGGKGGMKLAGLDKSEVAKEDREVLDTIRQYRAQIGKLRSAVASASAAPGLPKLPAVPDISETMPVKALKQSEGGITAREACALCGLKREERVVKLDDEGVQDSFGEWWLKDVSMHVQCHEFWTRESGKLKSR